MIISILLLIFGLVILIKGADWLVDGASALAKKFNVSDLAIGLTIVAFGTSAPELVVNSFASWQGYQDIVFGNIIGSNIFNLFAILGITGLITPLIVQSSTVWKEIPLSLFAAILLFFLANDFMSAEHGTLSRLDALILLAMFGLFLYYVYKQMKTDPTENLENDIHIYTTPKIWLLILGGLVGLVIGGRIVVNSAIEIAQYFGLSEKIIGLTIVAAGTSLPELATSVVAAIRKNADIAVGNIVGSNIFNLFLILSLSAFIRPIPYSTSFNTDIYLLVGGTIFLFAVMFVGKKHRLERVESALLLLTYVAYMIYLVMQEL